METMPMSDADGDEHDCTDWGIWTASPSELVWSASCTSGFLLTHIHLGDGTFTGSHAGRTALLADTDYKLRVRHIDSSGSASAYSQRLFTTGPPSQVFPLELNDALDVPPPTWTDESDSPLILPGGASPGFVRVEVTTGELIFAFEGIDGVTNDFVSAPPLATHHPVKVRMSGGGSALVVPVSRLRLTDSSGVDRTVFLPAMSISAGSTAILWIASNGSSYWGSPGQTDPDFSTLAQGAPVPWDVVPRGFKVEVVATGFRLPVNIAFVPNAGSNPNDPYYYVTELHGTVKVVRRDGTVSAYATNLLNYAPPPGYPGEGEQGLAGIVVDPATKDVLVGLLYDPNPPSGVTYPKIIRLHSNDGGRTAATQTTVLDMVGEPQGTSHFVSNLSIGPDGKLYVHNGDGLDASTALNLSSFRGKVLRLNLDGTAVPSNPFYNASDGISARDYVFAYGFRNPFGGAWRASDGGHYEVENGPTANDRLARVVAGQSYGWNGTAASMTTNAIYNWPIPHAPVNVVFIQPETHSASGFPPWMWDHAFVTESGPSYALGQQNKGKRIVEFVLDAAGSLDEGPTPFLEYTGAGRATTCGLTAGPDGLYFTDLYKDLGSSPFEPGANVLRVQFVGRAEFTSDNRHGTPPLQTRFFDVSSVPGAGEWLWQFGDGATSTQRNPTHVYETAGNYDVRLEVTGTHGTAVEHKTLYMIVGDVAGGVVGEYYNNDDFTSLVTTRLDPTINFVWGSSPPLPPMDVNRFSIRWMGRVSADFDEVYTFTTTTDDGVRLWVDGQLLIDEWHDQASTEHSGTIDLSAGQPVDLQMDYYDATGGALARLEWSSPSRPRQVIPSDHLYPPLSDPVLDVTGEVSSLRPRLHVPNPVGRASVIRFSVPESKWTRIVGYDVGGRAVATLFEGHVEAGHERRVVWDPSGLSNGVYFVQLRSGSHVRSEKVLVTR